jgi:hypothetical protein
VGANGGKKSVETLNARPVTRKDNNRSKNAKSHSLAVVGGTSAVVGGTSGGTTCTSAATARGFLLDAVFQAAALRSPVAAACVPAAFSFRVLAAFLPVDFNLRGLAGFFAFELRFVGMGIPLVNGVRWRRSYNA